MGPSIDRLTRGLANRDEQISAWGATTSRRGFLKSAAAVGTSAIALFGFARGAEAAYYTYVVRANTPVRPNANCSTQTLLTVPCGTRFYATEVAGCNPGFFNCTENTNIWMRGTFYNQYGVAYTGYVHRGNCDPSSGGACYC